jgi:transposase
MIELPHQIFVATQPIDLRLSFDRLAGIIRSQLGADPHHDAAFVFHNKRRTHLKILWHRPRGYALLYMRLDRGTYRIPVSIPESATHVRVSTRELALLLDGLDRSLLQAAKRTLQQR